MIEAGARPDDRAGLPGVRRGADRRGLDRRRSTARACPAGRRWWSRSSGPDAERQINADIQLLYQVARVAPGAGAAPPVHRPGRARSTSSPARSAASSTTASRRATPRSSGATSPATSRVAVPKIYWRYSTSRVLTMERVEGDGARPLDLGTWSPRRPPRLGQPASPRRGCRWSSSTASSTPTRIPANILVRGADQHQPGQLRDDRAAHAARPRGGGAAAARHPQPGRRAPAAAPARARRSATRARWRRSSPTGSGSSSSATRPAAIGEIDAREVLREIFQTIYRLDITLPGALGDARQDARDPGGRRRSRSTPTSTCSRSRAPTPCGWRPSASGPDHIADRMRHGRRALRRGLPRVPVPALRAARGVQGRRARDHGPSGGLQRRPWTSSRPARTASCWRWSPPR